MKKRKGKQPEAVEQAEPADSTETTVVDAPVPAAEAAPPEPEAQAIPEPAVEPSEPGDDDITSRWQVDEVEAAGLEAEGGAPAGEDDAAEASEELSAAEQVEASADEGSPSEEAAAGDEGADADAPEIEGSRLEAILESILFASDRPLGLADLKRLLGERDGKRLSAALESLREKRAEAGIQLVSVAGGWQLRTHPANGAWVAKLVAGRPPRLSRAMMETLAIVAYRQPITRPEIDEIRGVDCGPVLHTLLDRGLIRVIGKKEEVGRPMLYGTTPEFLKIFSLKDLSELPTLREFHELAAEDRARVDATVSEGAGATVVAVTDGVDGAPPPARPTADELPDPDPAEEDALLEALDQAASAAARATATADKPDEEAAAAAAAVEGDGGRAKSADE